MACVKAFPSFELEADVIRDRFGIDIEGSLRDWLARLVGLDADRVIQQGMADTLGGINALGVDEIRLRPPRDTVLTTNRARFAQLVCLGLTDREIASEMGVGFETVRTTGRMTQAALGARNRPHMVLLYLVGCSTDSLVVSDARRRGVSPHRRKAA